MASTRPFALPAHALQPRAEIPSLAARPRPTARRAGLRERLRAWLVIEFDIGEIEVDAATIHADLADLFERGDGLPR